MTAGPANVGTVHGRRFGRLRAERARRRASRRRDQRPPAVAAPSGADPITSLRTSSWLPGRRNRHGNHALLSELRVALLRLVPLLIEELQLRLNRVAEQDVLGRTRIEGVQSWLRRAIAVVEEHDVDTLDG